MGKLTKVLSLIAAAAISFPSFGQTVDPCGQTAKLSGGTTYTANGRAKLPNSPYTYEIWTEAGGGNTVTWYGPNAGGGAAFRATWNGAATDFLGRIGFHYGNGGTYSSYNHVYADYNYTRSGNNTGGGYSYIGLYGWTASPVVEWYIVEDYYGNGILNNTGILGTYKGEFTASTGAVYKIYRNTRPAGSGCVGCNGQAFPQYFSVRQRANPTPSEPMCGTVYVQEHFEAFEKYTDMKMGTSMYEISWLNESAARNTQGWYELSYLSLTQENQKRTSVPDDNFVLTTTASPAVGGTVTRTPDSASYSPNKTVELTATPNTGWKFDGWTGDDASSVNPLTVTMNANKNITAKFSPAADGTENLVKDGNFPGGSLGSDWMWNVGQYYGNSAGTNSVSGGKVTLNITAAGAETYQPQLIQQGISLDNGMKYRLTFTASAGSARSMDVSFQQSAEPWGDYKTEKFNLTAAEENYQLDFEMTQPGDPNVQLSFNVGGAGTDGTSVTISNVKLIWLADGGQNVINNRTPNAAKLNAGRGIKAAHSVSGLKVNFKAAAAGEAVLKLYSLKGDVISTAKLQTGAGKVYSHTFSTSKLPNGFYVVGLHSGGSVEQARVVIQK